MLDFNALIQTAEASPPSLLPYLALRVEVNVHHGGRYGSVLDSVEVGCPGYKKAVVADLLTPVVLLDEMGLHIQLLVVLLRSDNLVNVISEEVQSSWPLRDFQSFVSHHIIGWRQWHHSKYSLQKSTLTAVRSTCKVSRDDGGRSHLYS